MLQVTCHGVGVSKPNYRFIWCDEKSHMKDVIWTLRTLHIAFIELWGISVLSISREKVKCQWCYIPPHLCTRFAYSSLNSSDYPPPPPPRKNGCHFADDDFSCILVNGTFCTLIKISLKFCPIDNKPRLVEIMAWYRIGDKPLSEPMLTRFTDEYMRH